VSEGAFRNLPALRAAAGALGVKGVNVDRWPFRNLAGLVRVEGGRVVIDTLRFDQDQLGWRMAGAVAPDGEISLFGVVAAEVGAVSLPPALEVLAELVQDERGRIPIDFSVRGPVTAPEVLLDWDAFQTRAAETARDRQARELEEAIRKKVDDPEVLDRIQKILRGKKGGGR